MPVDKLEGVDRAYFKFELRSWSRELGKRLPMPAVGSFGRAICPYCGWDEKATDPGAYASHLIDEHLVQIAEDIERTKKAHKKCSFCHKTRKQHISRRTPYAPEKHYFQEKKLVCGGCGLKYPESQRQDWAVHRSRCVEKWRKVNAGESAGDRLE